MLVGQSAHRGLVGGQLSSNGGDYSLSTAKPRPGSRKVSDIDVNAGVNFPHHEAGGAYSTMLAGSGMGSPSARIPFRWNVMAS